MNSLNYSFDSQLCEVPENPDGMYAYVRSATIPPSSKPTARAKVLGELGAYMRILRNLDEAERYLIEALKLTPESDVVLRTTLEIRLAHIYQWQKNFSKSNVMFEEILQRCLTTPELKKLQHFAYQHCGKNYFDQGQYKMALQAFEKALALRQSNSAPADQIHSTEFAIAKVKELLGSHN